MPKYGNVQSTFRGSHQLVLVGGAADGAGRRVLAGLAAVVRVDIPERQRRAVGPLARDCPGKDDRDLRTRGGLGLPTHKHNLKKKIQR